MSRQPTFGTPEYAAMMRPFVKDASETAAPADPKLSDPIISPRIQSLAVFLAVEFAKQDNELDNLGDGESIVFMGKCPTINLVQLAEKIIEYHNTEAATLQRRIDELARIIKLGETIGDNQ